VPAFDFEAICLGAARQFHLVETLRVELLHGKRSFTVDEDLSRASLG
jgi:hypothetical protein